MEELRCWREFHPRHGPTGPNELEARRRAGPECGPEIGCKSGLSLICSRPNLPQNCPILTRSLTRVFAGSSMVDIQPRWHSKKIRTLLGMARLRDATGLDTGAPS